MKKPASGAAAAMAAGAANLAQAVANRKAAAKKPAAKKPAPGRKVSGGSGAAAGKKPLTAHQAHLAHLAHLQHLGLLPKAAPKPARRMLALGEGVACCAAEAVAGSLRLSAPKGAVDATHEGIRDWPRKRLAREFRGQVADLVADHDGVDIALVGHPGADIQGSCSRGNVAGAHLYTPAAIFMHGDDVAFAMRGDGPEHLIAASHQVYAGDHLGCRTDIDSPCDIDRHWHNGSHGRAHPSVDGPARPDRLAGSIISDSDVLDLYLRTAADLDSGASILVTLEAAARYGVAGYAVASFQPVDLAEIINFNSPLILGLELPEGPHAVLDDGSSWWSWGEPYDLDAFPGAVIEEAWAVTWG